MQGRPSGELLEKALRRLEDLEKLISSLRLLILLESGQRSVRERFSLRSVLGSILEDLREEMERKGLSVELTGEDVEVESDREKLYVLLKNLVENAVRYNRKGGRVSVRIERDERGIKILIEDTGEGVPKNCRLPRSGSQDRKRGGEGNNRGGPSALMKAQRIMALTPRTCSQIPSRSLYTFRIPQAYPSDALCERPPSCRSLRGRSPRRSL